jgi:hypothetical protein
MFVVLKNRASLECWYKINCLYLGWFFAPIIAKRLFLSFYLPISVFLPILMYYQVKFVYALIFLVWKNFFFFLSFFPWYWRELVTGQHGNVERCFTMYHVITPWGCWNILSLSLSLQQCMKVFFLMMHMICHLLGLLPNFMWMFFQGWHSWLCHIKGAN